MAVIKRTMKPKLSHLNGIFNGLTVLALGALVTFMPKDKNPSNTSSARRIAIPDLIDRPTALVPRKANRNPKLAKRQPATSAVIPSGLGAPVKTGIITSLYGLRCLRTRYNDCTRKPAPFTFHGGIDIGAPIGTPVMAIHDGRAEINEGSKFGHYLTLKGKALIGGKTRDVKTVYAHLDDVPKLSDGTVITDGMIIGKGMVIGKVGDTGNARGPHLHLEVFIDGVRLNPLHHVASLQTMPSLKPIAIATPK